MENTTNNTPQEGTWNTMETERPTTDRKEKVTFEMNQTVEVRFSEHFVEPREFPNQNADGVFYVFDVETSEGEGVIMTSAWTLLRGLKTLGELAGRNVKITKTLVNGRQSYKVEDASYN